MQMQCACSCCARSAIACAMPLVLVLLWDKMCTWYVMPCGCSTGTIVCLTKASPFSICVPLSGSALEHRRQYFCRHHFDIVLPSCTCTVHRANCHVPRSAQQHILAGSYEKHLLADPIRNSCTGASDALRTDWSSAVIIAMGSSKEPSHTGSVAVEAASGTTCRTCSTSSASRKHLTLQ